MVALTHALAGGEQHPECLTFSALAGLDEMLAGQRLTSGAYRVEGVGLATATLGRPLGAADLHHPFAGRLQERRQAGAVAAGSFKGPAAAARDVLAGELQELKVAVGVSGRFDVGEYSTQCTDRGSGQGVAVGIDPDDAIDLLCQRGHAVASFPGRLHLASARMGSPGGRTVTSHAQAADELLIKPTG